jgi:hypothetical protein
MLKSYEGIVENGQVRWLAERPMVDRARVIVTVLEEQPSSTKRRTASPSIAGKGRTLGDLVQSIVDDQDWDCLK